MVAQGETGFYTIQSSAATTARAAPSRPSCASVRRRRRRCRPARRGRSRIAPSPHGTLPGSLPASTRTLFLSTASSSSRSTGRRRPTPCATRSTRSSRTSAGGTEPWPAAMLEVTASAAVRAAYAAWDASPCSIDAANDVMQRDQRRRRRLPGRRPAEPRYVDAARQRRGAPDGTAPGSDDDLARARRRQRPPLPRRPNLTRGTRSTRRLRSSHFLSDAPYGSYVTIPWLNRQLYLPTAAGGAPRRDAGRHPAAARALRAAQRRPHTRLGADHGVRLPHRRRARP